MNNYNEALESEKRTLSLLVETSFYQNANNIAGLPQTDESAIIINAVLNNSLMAQQIMQLIQSSAIPA